MAPLLQHALLMTFLTATVLAAAAAGGSSSGGLAPVLLQAKLTHHATHQSGGGRGFLDEEAYDAAVKEKDAQCASRNSPPRQQVGKKTGEPLWRLQQRRLQRRFEGFQRRRRGTRRGRRTSAQPGGNGQTGDIGGRRGPFATVARVSDGLRARAQQLFGEEVGRKQSHNGGAARRDLGLAFGHRGVRKRRQALEKKQEVLNAQLLALQAENDASVVEVLSLIESDGWEYVTSKSGVVVVRKFIPPSPKASGAGVVDEGAAAKFACVKAMGTLDARAIDLYKLFLDNQRVHEYNENCREVRDLEWLSRDTKVSWAATPRHGPFKSRDFVTAVHYRTLEDGTMMVINRPVEHAAARRGKTYVRAEILIATNIMRPNREDPNKTDFISVTHINPGGIADSRIGAAIVNKLCAKAPVNLLVALQRAANSPPVPREAVANEDVAG